MKINTNVVSMQTQDYLRKSNMNLETSMERLSSGKRINSAKDDAAGLAITQRMISKIRGMEVGTRNSNDGVSLVQTAEAGLASISSILQRMRELSVQSANGTYNATDRASLDKEYKQLSAEINHIAQSTSFNGVNLLDGSSASIVLQLTEESGDTLTIDLTDAQTTVLNGGTGITNDISTVVGANTALTDLEVAINEIADKRAGFGSYLNRLNFNIDNLTSMKNNLEQARSRIEDADMAKEVSEMTKFKILAQSGVSMLTQANQNPQLVNQLLQG